METITLDKDINVLYVAATSFPDGVMDAHNRIRALTGDNSARKLFGLSRPENGTIRYLAAVEQLMPGEAEKLKCDSMAIKKGRYNMIVIPNFMKDIPAIGKAFSELLAKPDIDPQGYCVEWYNNDTDVKCMVRLNS